MIYLPENLIMKIEFQKETRLHGIAVSPGIACAKICLFNENRHASLEIYHINPNEQDLEKKRFTRAFKVAIQQLEALHSDISSRIGGAEAEIFTAHIGILNDPKIASEIEELIDKNAVNAEAAVSTIMDSHEARLLKIDNEYIRDRATDIGEIKRRLLDILANINPSLLCAGQPHCQKGRNRIIVAEELTPTLTVELDSRQTRGFVTERGGKTSHAAILARALGIPAVTGIAGIHGALTCGTELLINGNTGEVIVWPSEATKAAVPPDKVALPGDEIYLQTVPGFKVMANISLARDVEAAVSRNAEGIGLYRTEFEFFAADRLLTEDEQAERYTSVIKHMNGKKVIVRLLDVGGDKSEPFLGITSEQNPYLGLRGGRFLLSRPDLLGTQARALARASAHGVVHVLYPMIIDHQQFMTLKGIFTEATRGLDCGKIFHGIMFEVPSACLQARELLAAADFGSVGTNDLIQYLFAVDRNNERVSADYSADRPVFWDLLETLARTARELKKSLSVCGELASDPAYVKKLMQIGIEEISVSAKLIPGVRKAALSP
jgi:phosphotransferase system enzyme I (PtsI)